MLYCSLTRLRMLTRDEWHVTEGQVLAFGVLGASAPLAWMIWNWVIFGSPLAFQTGTYAKPSNWVSTGERTVHNLWISLRTYEIATVDNVTALVTILAVLGLAVYLWRTRLSRESLPLLALLVMFPMFVVTLYKGQRPLHVYQFYYNYYNVRFGLVMLLPACLLVGYLVASAAALVPARFPARVGALLRALPAAAVICAVAVIGGHRAAQRGHRHAGGAAGRQRDPHRAARAGRRGLAPAALHRRPGAHGVLREREPSRSPRIYRCKTRCTRAATGSGRPRCPTRAATTSRGS